jgi:RNA polymerase sigma-70 factor, ECF subfamily
LKAFEEIYQSNYISLHRTAQKMLGNGYDVKDIVQEVFVDFFEKTKRGVQIQYPGSWLYRVTLNKCMDVLRKDSKYADAEPSQNIADNSSSLETRETKALMSACLSELKPHERALCILYSEGLSYKEMAEITGIPFSSVGKTLSRTLCKLEKLLKEKGYEMYR